MNAPRKSRNFRLRRWVAGLFYLLLYAGCGVVIYVSQMISVATRFQEMQQLEVSLVRFLIGKVAIAVLISTLLAGLLFVLEKRAEVQFSYIRSPVSTGQRFVRRWLGFWAFSLLCALLRITDLLTG